MRLQLRFILILALVGIVGLGYAQAVAAAQVGPHPDNQQCFSCHGNSSLSTTRDGKEISMYVDKEQYNNTPHSLVACTRCHEELQAEPKLSADGAHPEEVPQGREARIVISERCQKCHQGVVSESYERSFHGHALKLGSTTVATCVDCHGVHNILPEEDPDSLVNKANVPGTCGTAQCHPGAGPGIAEGEEHFIPAKAGNPLLGYLWKFFVALILFDTLMNGPTIAFELIRRLREDLQARRAKRGGLSHDA